MREQCCAESPHLCTALETNSGRVARIVEIRQREAVRRGPHETLQAAIQVAHSATTTHGGRPFCPPAVCDKTARVAGGAVVQQPAKSLAHPRFGPRAGRIRLLHVPSTLRIYRAIKEACAEDTIPKQVVLQ